MEAVSRLLISGEQDSSEFIMDRMSSLPLKVLVHILGKLSIIEVARMSVLAKYWRYKWLSVPNLTIDTCVVGDVLYKGNTRWDIISSIINRFLRQHTCAIKTFYLSAQCKPHYSDVYSWLRYLARQNIEALYLKELGPQHLEMPSHLFNFTNLRSLLLESCVLQVPSTFGGFNTLQELSFGNVMIRDDDLKRLILACPLLMKLTLLKMSALNHLRICAPILSMLEIDTQMQDIVIQQGAHLVSVCIRCASNDERMIRNWQSVIRCLSGLQALEKLVLYGDFVKVMATEYALDTFPLRNNTLTYLSLCNVRFDTLEVLRVCLSLIRFCQNIRSFKLTVLAAKGQKLVTSFLKENHGLYSFPELVSISVSFPTGIGMGCTVNFIEFLCAHSPNLKTLSIEKEGKLEMNSTRVSQMLSRFRKIRPHASVQYTNNSQQTSL